MLDDADQVVRPALIWCDVRTEKQCRELTDKIGAQELIRLTCNPALPNFTLTKFMWVRENEPQNWKRVRSVMLPKDYVRFRLTGERATDMADASGTLLLDVANRRWSGRSCRRPAYKSPAAAAVRVSRYLRKGFYERALLLPDCRRVRRSWPGREIRRRARSAWASRRPAR